jgi:hypothetical protein
MAYLCPVCADPQVDAGHLANHVAFTAVIREGDHEAWLDEHVPGWGEDDEDELAERLLELDAVATVDHPIDAAADDDPTGGHTHDHGQGQNPAVEGQTRGSGALDAEAREILDEAQQLTREMEQSSDEPATGEEASEGETE